MCSPSSVQRPEGNKATRAQGRNGCSYKLSAPGRTQLSLRKQSAPVSHLNGDGEKRHRHFSVHSTKEG